MKKALLIPFSVVSILLQAQSAPDLLATAGGPAPDAPATAPNLELVSFVAQSQGDRNVQVRWSTLSEGHNELFILERSGDLRQWEAIAEVAGAGPHDEVRAYEVEDEAPLPGVSYYRLDHKRNGRVVELSDLFSVSRPVQQVLLIEPRLEPGRFAVSAHGDLTDVRLMNNRGQFITMSLDIRADEVVVNAELLEPGTYYIQANVDGNPVLRPVIITTSTVIGG
ncbi:MAG TPA: hypothetical protein VGE21_01925 [Flavobacteriales bacterium]